MSKTWTKFTVPQGAGTHLAAAGGFDGAMVCVTVIRRRRTLADSRVYVTVVEASTVVSGPVTRAAAEQGHARVTVTLVSGRQIGPVLRAVENIMAQGVQ